MGYWKDWQQAQEDQGWSYSNRTVCHSCVTDEYLKEVVRAKTGSSPCSFCERAGRRPRRGAPFDALTAVVSETIRQCYCHALGELPWDSEVGDYWGENCDTADLINGYFYEISDVDEVRQEIIDCLGDDQWCEVNPFGFSGVERYRVSWGQFCTTVKHETRYFFNSVQTGEEREGSDRDLTPVPEVLGEIGTLLANIASEAIIDQGDRISRVRRHLPHEVCADWRALGSPPRDSAPNNRMSAAGMSVFYGAFDMSTAAREVAAGVKPREKAKFTGANWITTRPLTVIDLSNMPPLPSVFALPRDARDPHVFLREFVREIMKPVAHDGKEHIEYVPTQILTEYLRLVYQTASGGRIDGLIYPSAQRKGGRSVVIFASHDDLDPTRQFRANPPPLVLDDQSIRSVRRPRAGRTPRLGP